MKRVKLVRHKDSRLGLEALRAAGWFDTYQKYQSKTVSWVTGLFWSRESDDSSDSGISFLLLLTRGAQGSRARPDRGRRGQVLD